MGWQLSFQHNIRKLDLATRFQHPEYLLEQDLFTWREIDNSVRDRQIKKIVREREVFRIHLFNFEISSSGGSKILPGAAGHFIGQINAIPPTTLTCQSTGHEQIETSPAADIKDGCTSRYFAKGKRVTDPAKGFKETGVGVVYRIRVVFEGYCSLFAGRVREFTGGRNSNFGVLLADSGSDSFEILRGELRLRCFLTILPVASSAVSRRSATRSESAECFILHI